MSGGDDWDGEKVRRARARWTTRLPLPCWHCGRPVDGRTGWVVEHDPPRWQQRRAGVRVIIPASEVGVSHRRCSDASGGRVGARQTNTRRAASSTRARPLEDRPLAW